MTSLENLGPIKIRCRKASKQKKFFSGFQILLQVLPGAGGEKGGFLIGRLNLEINTYALILGDGNESIPLSGFSELVGSRVSSFICFGENTHACTHLYTHLYIVAHAFFWELWR